MPKPLTLRRPDYPRSSPRPRIVIGHPYMGRGGSEARVMWLIEALKQECEMTVATTGGWNLAALNAFYGTDVRENEVRVRIAPVPLLLRGQSAAALRGACYQRFARQIAGEYDVRISAYNATDWGMFAIHFIADFSWHREIRERLHSEALGLVRRNSMLHKTYLWITSLYGWPSGRDVLKEDVLIANSMWTAGILKGSCSVDCAAVVYPSVWTRFPLVPWTQKKTEFVMIGRIAPEKADRARNHDPGSSAATRPCSSTPSMRPNRRRSLRTTDCEAVQTICRLDHCRRTDQWRQEGSDPGPV